MSIAEIIAKLTGQETVVTALQQSVEKLEAKLSTAHAEVNENGNRVERLESDLATARQTIQTLTRERDQLATENLAASDKLAASDLEVEKRANLKLHERATQLGIPPVKEESRKPTANADLEQQLSSIKDPYERAEFYRQNKEAIVAAFRPR